VKAAAAVPVARVAAARSSAAAAPHLLPALKPEESAISSPTSSTVAAAATAAAIPHSQSRFGFVTSGIEKLQAHARAMLTRLDQQPSAATQVGETAHGEKAVKQPSNEIQARPCSTAGSTCTDGAAGACIHYNSAPRTASISADTSQSECCRQIAAAPPTPPPTPPPRRPFGLSLEKDRASAGYLVASIAPFSPASAEPRLKKGALVLELNGQACKGLSAAQVEDMLEGRGCCELRVTVKKSWLWGVTTAVLKMQNVQLGASSAANGDSTAAADVSILSDDDAAADKSTVGADVPFERTIGVPNLDLDQQLRSRAAVAVAANKLGAWGDAGGALRGDDSMMMVPIATASPMPSAQQQRNNVNDGGFTAGISEVCDGRSSAIMTAVEQNLALLFDKYTQQQQLDRRTTAARARIAVTQASVAAHASHAQEEDEAARKSSVGSAVQCQGALVDLSEEVLESSIGKAMMKRLGEDGLGILEAPAAAAVAEAAIVSASRQKIANDKERSDRAALAEAVARQSALTLEARAVVAGEGQGCYCSAACFTIFTIVSLMIIIFLSCTLTLLTVKRAAVNRAVMTQAREG
jgi:hypothetical protein